MIQEKRPHIQLRWFELEQHAKEHYGDIEYLQVILAELKFRKSKKAVKLYREVAARISELSILAERKFRWPSTAVCANSTQALRSANFDYEDGLLKFMGYTVGQHGAYRNQRRMGLDYVFNERVPLVHSQEYMNEWGEPQTAKRLKKLAYSLASFVRNAKLRQTADLRKAINEWEEDLKYLKAAYYDGFDFKWPE